MTGAVKVKEAIKINTFIDFRGFPQLVCGV